MNGAFGYERKADPLCQQQTAEAAESGVDRDRESHSRTPSTYPGVVRSPGLGERLEVAAGAST